MHIAVCHSPVFRAELLNRYEEGTTLAGFIYVHRISDNRFDGITGRNFIMFRKLCGESTLKDLVLVTNMWGEDTRDADEAREKELSNSLFKPALDNGAQMVRHHDTAQSAYDIIRTIVVNHSASSQIQGEMEETEQEGQQAEAGENIVQELKEQIEQHQAKLREARAENVQALKARDGKMKQELEKIQGDLEEEVEKIMKISEGLGANYAAEKEWMGTKMDEIEQEAKQGREAEYDQRLAVLMDCLELTNASEDDRDGWLQEIKRLHDRVTIPIYKCVFELAAFPFHLGAFLNDFFSASTEEDQIGRTRVYLSTDRVSNARKELLKDTRPRGLLCVCCYFSLTFLLTPKAERATYMLRSFYVGN